MWGWPLPWKKDEEEDGNRCHFSKLTEDGVSFDDQKMIKRWPKSDHFSNLKMDVRRPGCIDSMPLSKYKNSPGSRFLIGVLGITIIEEILS